MLRIGLGIGASYFAQGKVSEIVPPPPPPATTTPAPPPPPPTVYSLTVYEDCALDSLPTTVYSLSPVLELGIILYNDYELSSYYASKIFYNGNTVGSWTQFGTNVYGQLNLSNPGFCSIT